MNKIYATIVVVLLISLTVFGSEPEIITKNYYPIDTPQTFAFWDNNTKDQYVYKYLGLCSYENRMVYAISYSSLGNNEECLLSTSLYSMNNEGDIYSVGSISGNKLKWSKKPTLKLKGKMVINKPYVIESVPNLLNRTLTLEGFKDITVDGRKYLKCLEVKDYLKFDKKTAPDSLDMVTITYYAKDTGMVKIVIYSLALKNGKYVVDGSKYEGWRLQRRKSN